MPNATVCHILRIALHRTVLTFYSQKLKRTLSAGAVASPINTKKAHLDEAASLAASLLPTKTPLLKVLKHFLVASPEARLRNPHIFIDLKAFLITRKITEKDLQRTWKCILRVAPEQCAFVTSIKSDKNGQLIGFQGSGDGALAARDCYLLASGELREKFKHRNISLKLALYEDESRRVAMDYKFDFVEWRVEKI